MAQTPSTWDDYVGDGLEDTFQVTFPYQKQQEVFVTVDGDPAAFTFISAGWIQLAAVPANGAVIRVQRSTEAFEPRHEFANGVPLLPRFIDENNKQFLYVVQETVNETAGTAAMALSQANQAVATADAAADLIGSAVQDSALYLRNDLANSVDPAKGAALVGFAGATVADALAARVTSATLSNAVNTNQGAAIIGRSGQVIGSIADLRLLDKTAASRHAFVTGYYAQGDGGGGSYYFDAADTTSADNGRTIIVAADGGRWKRLSATVQNVTTATDVATSKIARITSHTGGTPGFVNSALRIDTTVGSAVTDFEWGLTSTLDNYAAAGENVSIYAQAKKLNTGPTWAMVAEARDEVSTGNPRTGLVGIEVDVFSNGIDDFRNRVGIDIVVGRHNPVGAACECGIGIRLNPQGRSDANGYFDVGIKFDGRYNACIDMTGVTGGVGLVMVQDQKICFEATRVVNINFNSSANRVDLEGSKRFHASGGLSFPSAGLVSTTASAGVHILPANPAGFLSVLIDGVVVKIPFYGA